MLLANSFAVVADAIFAEPAANLGPAAAWTGAVCYALQIYFDFAGYSNMAIGMGRMFGFDLPKNFNFPYTAQSVTEFWRRWHITLSNWFRDYLYIPLGGNRRGGVRTAINLWIVFLLCGLWHGAALAFVVWGALHGAMLVLERSPVGRLLRAAPRILRHGYVLVFLTLSWVPFRTADLADAWSYYAAMFGLLGGEPLPVDVLVAEDVDEFVIVGLIVALWPLWGEMARAVWRRLGAPAAPSPLALVGGAIARVWTPLALATLLLLSAALIAGGAYNPFIYFRF